MLPLRIFKKIAGIVVVFIATGISISGQSPSKVEGYKKLVRPGSSLWRETVCELDLALRRNFCKYFRFYDDGTVISVTTSGSPREIKKWFRRPYGDYGKYIVDRYNISFAATSSAGTIEYKGTIKGNQLILDINSKINGYRATRSYSWVRPSPRKRSPARTLPQTKPKRKTK